MRSGHTHRRCGARWCHSPGTIDPLTRSTGSAGRRVIAGLRFLESAPPFPDQCRDPAKQSRRAVPPCLQRRYPSAPARAALRRHCTPYSGLNLSAQQVTFSWRGTCSRSPARPENPRLRRAGRWSPPEHFGVAMPLAVILLVVGFVGSGRHCHRFDGRRITSTPK